MNKQKVFDKVLEKLTKQKSPCMHRNMHTCMYAQGKKRCAIGHLLNTKILARLKKEDCLTVALQDLDEQLPAIYKNIKQQLKVRTPRDLRFLNDLQNAHDSGIRPYASVNMPTNDKDWFFNFMTEMKIIAHRYKLKISA